VPKLKKTSPLFQLLRGTAVGRGNGETMEQIKITPSVETTSNMWGFSLLEAYCNLSPSWGVCRFGFFTLFADGAIESHHSIKRIQKELLRRPQRVSHSTECPNREAERTLSNRSSQRHRPPQTPSTKSASESYGASDGRSATVGPHPQREPVLVEARTHLQVAEEVLLGVRQK
jgi:hypothetical protein